MQKFLHWIQNSYGRITRSIAFYPALIGIAFLLASWLSIMFDFSEQGKQIKSTLSWLSLHDATTARSIISSILTGIISLMVFSFSLVMIVLNQAAGQMSNRVLSQLIGNRFQQVVLGIYIGTIVYALLLLSTIRDIDSGVYIPALSTYLLILLTVVDIFIFIYFLHYITQSVKYEVVIERICSDTQKSLLDFHKNLKQETTDETFPEKDGTVLKTLRAGIYEHARLAELAATCKKYDCRIRLLPEPGAFLLAGCAVAVADRILSKEAEKEITGLIRVNNSESVARNYIYGCRQLMEIAVRALSPGINDPDTAVLSLRAMFIIFDLRAGMDLPVQCADNAGTPRVFLKQPDLTYLFQKIFLPVWDYDKDDRIVGQETAHLLEQLHMAYPKNGILYSEWGKILAQRKE